MNKGTKTIYQLEGIEREEATDFPIDSEEHETEVGDLKSWIIELLMKNDLTSEEAHEYLYDLHEGVTGELYTEEDHDGMVLVEYSFVANCCR